MKNQRWHLLMPLLLLVCSQVYAHDHYYAEIKKYAVSLYQSFDQKQLNIVSRAFEDSNRLKWNNLPVGMRPRPGISIAAMGIDQRKMLHRILSASLSSQGYLKATGIMHLDDLLNTYYAGLHADRTINDSVYQMIKDLKWAHENYFFTFFGNPSNKIWGYKLEGHHLSVNFTFTGEKISVTPLFVGTDPAEFPNTAYAGWRVLGQEEDLGIRLIHLLDAAQQKKATMSTEVPGDIITAAESGKRLIEYWGLPGAEMTKDQRDVLQQIVREFVFNLDHDKAIMEYEKILKAGMEKIYFGWIGPYVEEAPHYYVINGPGFLIEFDNRSNHIHAIWREKGNEYGEDVLKQHYMLEKH